MSRTVAVVDFKVSYRKIQAVPVDTCRPGLSEWSGPSRTAAAAAAGKSDPFILTLTSNIAFQTNSPARVLLFPPFFLNLPREAVSGLSCPRASWSGRPEED